MAAFSAQPLTWMVTSVAILVVGATAFAQSPALAQNTAVKAGESRAVQIQDTLKTCYQCHGAGGVSEIPSRPTLAGQKADYLRRQLLAFKMAGQAIDPSKAGQPGTLVRPDPVMEHKVTNVGDDLIAPIAAALSNMACDGGKPRQEETRTFELPKAGQACVGCHGVNGIGTKAQVPNLAGQQRSYLRRQLLLIRERSWGAAPREGEAWRSHPILEAHAARLSIVDIDAVARYYSALPCNGGETVMDKPKAEK